MLQPTIFKNCNFYCAEHDSALVHLCTCCTINCLSAHACVQCLGEGNMIINSVLARSKIKAGWWFLYQSIFGIFNIFPDHIKENLLKKGGWSPLLCCFGENPDKRPVVSLREGNMANTLPPSLWHYYTRWDITESVVLRK